ncbi:hypothetical protein ACFX2C_039460 [Malus domestica]
MVSASQLQLLQSPITALISTISTSINVKLDDSNYLNWHFQMQLLLESNGIMGFVDGSTPCPARFAPNSGDSGVNSATSSSGLETDEYTVWKLHDRALMQLVTATLSPVAMSCAIGSASSRELWTRLKEQFSTVSKTSIFQMKSNLQTIKKGSDSVTRYLQKIKEARDYLSAASVFLDDEDIIILALNGLPPEYNTFCTVVRGRESVMTMKEFRTQLLAEEEIVDSHSHVPFLSAMVVNNTSSPVHKGSNQAFNSGGGHSFHHTGGQSYGVSGGFKPYVHKNKGKGKFNGGQRYYTPRPMYHTQTHVFPTPTPGVLGSSPSAPLLPTCQLCNAEGHTAPYCYNKSSDRQQCQICGKFNHTTWYCFYNEKGPSYMGPQYSQRAGTPMQGYSYNVPHVLHGSHPSSLQAMNTVFSPTSPSSHMGSVASTSQSPQVWLTDSGATTHMTADLNNLSLASPYPSNEVVQTANGEGLRVSHIGSSILNTSKNPITLNSILYVPKLTQNLLSVHKLCLDNNCWLIFDAFYFWIQDKVTGRIMYKAQCSNGLYPIHSLSTSFLPSQSSHVAFLGHLVGSSLWHTRFGHPSNNVVSLLLKQANIPCNQDVVSHMCQSCLKGKFTQLPFPSTHVKSVIPFQIVHSDLWGPAPCTSIDGYKYYVTLIDECTRFCWLFPLSSKSDFTDVFVTFCAFVSTQFSTSVKILQTDGG